MMMIEARILPQFRIEPQPVADPAAIVIAGKARFTLLTSRLVRMEYSPDGSFEDRPSQVFWYKRQAVPEFRVTEAGGELQIETKHLTLRYRKGEIFSPETLSIKVKATEKEWHYGDEDPDNLRGTARTLDLTNGPIPLGPGLVSRSGWALVDDSTTLVFDPEGWLQPREAPPGAMDLYFFGFGHDYTACLRDFARISGNTPLLPRWALGNWWSRYWEYTQEGLQELVQTFKSKSVPLSVLIIDMDWHITRTGNTSTGWTGYTWNRELFTDPDALLHHLHEHGLKVALNLHPAEGIHPHEAKYPQMAKAMGIDPATGQPVPFDLADPNFTRAYFNILHHPEEQRGVDFWWLDWQQGTLSGLPGLDPLWWLNHLHALDIARDGEKRRFIFSRWGGLGNQRYPIGFSGDTYVTWRTLAFQPYFTATAANVGYGWWSHDIGGHMSGREDPELYARWVQYGVFSPIMRLHSTKNPFHERLPWGYDAETEQIAAGAMRLRHALIPYLYTAAYQDATQAIPPTRPMYYLHPEDDQAYACPNQYTFGSELIAAPYVTPVDPDTQMATQVVWLPPVDGGAWFDFFTGLPYPAGGWQALHGTRREIPLFARPGAIVPMGPVSGWDNVDPPVQLHVHIFPGASNRFVLYEDDGQTSAYQDGKCAITPFSVEWQADRLVFRKEPVQGEYANTPLAKILVTRSLTLHFHALAEPETIAIDIPGEQPPAPTYDPITFTLTITGLQVPPDQSVTITLATQSGSLLAERDFRRERLVTYLNAFAMQTRTKSILVDRLDEILEDTQILSRYRASLTDSQLRAIMELLAGAGMAEINRGGEPLLLLWNNDADPRWRYNLSVEQATVWDPGRRFFHAQGPLPRFRLFHKDFLFARNAWALDLHYGDLLSLAFHGGDEAGS